MTIPRDFFYGRKLNPGYKKTFYYAQFAGRRDLLVKCRIELIEDFIDQKTADLIGYKGPINPYFYHPRSMEIKHIHMYFRELWLDSLMSMHDIVRIMPQENAKYVAELFRKIRNIHYDEYKSGFVLAYTIVYQDMTFFNQEVMYQVGKLDSFTDDEIRFILGNKLSRNMEFNHDSRFCIYYPPMFCAFSYSNDLPLLIDGVLDGNTNILRRKITTEFLTNIMFRINTIYELYVNKFSNTMMKKLAEYVVKMAHINALENFDQNHFDFCIKLLIQKSYISPLNIVFHRTIIRNDALIKSELQHSAAHIYFMVKAIKGGYFRVKKPSPLKKILLLNDDLIRRVLSKAYMPFNDNHVDYVSANEPFLTYR